MEWGRGAAFLSRRSQSDIVLLSSSGSHRSGLSRCPFQALSRFPKSRRERGGGGRRCGFNRKLSPDSAHLPASLPRPDVRLRSGSSHRDRKRLRPGHLAPPHRSASVPGRRSRAGAAGVGPRRRPGARSALAAPNLGPDSPRRRRRLPAYMAPSVPRSPARKGCRPRRWRRQRSPNSLRN